MEISSSTGTISFGQQFDVTRPHEQENTLDHLITEETMKKTYPFTLKVKAVIDGQTLEDSENLFCHYCVDLHTKISEEDYQEFKESLDTQNLDQRIFFASEEEG